MQEAAYRLESRFDHRIAINIVDEQIENVKSIPFFNEHEKLERAQLRHDMETGTEKGFSINLHILSN